MPQNKRWAILEWNPSVPVSSNASTVYADEMPIVERYRPAMLTPFLWLGDGTDSYLIKDTGFQTALGTLIGNIQNVPATCSYSLSSTPPPLDSIGGNGTITVTAGSPVGTVCPWTLRSDSPWLTFSASSTSTGTNNATVTFTAPKSGPSGRFTRAKKHASRTVRVKTNSNGIAVAPEFDS